MSKLTLVKKFDFSWKSSVDSRIAELAFKHTLGDTLDVGCGTCQLYYYLRRKGWKGQYIGIDMKKYEGCSYPHDAYIILGDATSLEFPKADTCILYNILEHVEDPLPLLSKALESCRNALISIPKRNEELWNYGFSELHQLDKTHKHCGFTRESIDRSSVRSKRRGIRHNC